MEYNFKVEILKEAYLDIEEHFNYYLFKKNDHQTAKNFVSEVKSKINSLKNFPYYQIRENSFRAVPLKMFPYLIFFEVNEKRNLVKVLRIFNTNQNPEKYP